MPTPITLTPDDISLDADPATGIVQASVSWTADPGNNGRIKLVSCNPADGNVPRDEYEYQADAFLPPNTPPPIVADHAIMGMNLRFGSTYACKAQTLLVDFTGDLDAAPVVSEGDFQIVTPALPQPADVMLVHPRAVPWLIHQHGFSIVSVHARRNGAGVADVPVNFKIVRGKGRLTALGSGPGGNEAQDKTNQYGVARVFFRPTDNHQRAVIKISSAQAANHTFAFIRVW